MRKNFRLLVCPLSTPAFDERLQQFLCHAGAITVLVLGSLKVSRLGLDEGHLFLGALLEFALTTLLAIAGTLAGRSTRAA
jgi:hypothetical protein